MDNIYLSVGNTGLEDFENSKKSWEKSTSCDEEQLAYDEKAIQEKCESFLSEFENLEWNPYAEKESTGRNCDGQADAFRINDSTVHPYKMVCRLLVKSKRRYSTRSLGTGFFISPRCIITAGHNLYQYVTPARRDWAEDVLVIPGGFGDEKPFGCQVSDKLRSVKGFIDYKDTDYDFGAIILPNCYLYKQVGAFFDYGNLPWWKSEVTNIGYKGSDKKEKTQWNSEGLCHDKEHKKLYYKLETETGHSGGPVIEKSFFKKNKIVGVHRGGVTDRVLADCFGEDCIKEAVRARSKVIQKWNEWTNL